LLSVVTKTGRRHEQARDLTIALLKEWLVKYKFKNWKKHRTNPSKIGQPVTAAEKEQRATEIARPVFVFGTP
jgi:hypothetical protein